MAALSLPKSSPQPRNRKALACYQAAMAGAPPARLASKDEAPVPLPMLKRIVRGGEATGRIRVNPFSIGPLTLDSVSAADADADSARSTAPP